MNDILERAARAAWNENPTREIGMHVVMGETGVSFKHLGYVLWDDEDMRESDREIMRNKMRAAFAVVLDELIGIVKGSKNV